MESFAERLEWGLKNKGISEDALAQKLGISQQAVNNWKLGKNKSKRMFEVADELDLNPEWLIKGRGDPHKKSRLDQALNDLISVLREDNKQTALKILQALKNEQDDANHKKS